jgi:Domain of unknown function (DUF6901)
VKTFAIEYHFRFPDGHSESFDLHLDAATLDLVEREPAGRPSWTILTVHQCPNCPLDSEVHSHCPAAVALVRLVSSCTRLVSHERLAVEVVTPERVISNEIPAQRGISSLMGLILASSGCPRTAFLKPMARFHLPLASPEETLYRASSMYLLAQYFLRRDGAATDLDLDGLKAAYDDLHTVNHFLAERLRRATEKDSAVNALVLLDYFAKNIPIVIEDSLEEIRYLFVPSPAVPQYQT